MSKVDKKKLKNLTKNHKYLQDYLEKIKGGEHGDKFLKPTQLFLVQ